MHNCKCFKLCGGCNFKLDDYNSSCDLKFKQYLNLFKGYKVEKLIKCKNPYFYRNKAQVSFSSINNKILMGNYIENSHTIVEFDKCYIIDEIMNSIFMSIKNLIVKYKISIFNEHTYKGFLRHAMLRVNDKKQYLLTLVVGHLNFKNQDKFIKEITSMYPNICGICLNLNNSRTSMVLGPKTILIYGKSYLIDNILGYKFQLSTQSFFQVNHEQTEVLYDIALKSINILNDEVVIDAYCGTGTITILASKYCKKVIGVELNKTAVKDAIKNANRNKVKNIDFIAQDAGKYMQFLAKKNYRVDTLIMDPPRSGASFEFINSIYKLKPKKILYISCSPITLKRDLKLLEKLYKVNKIIPVDLFAFTEHIETVVTLTLNI